MLELYGSGYVIEYCIAAFNRLQEEKLYRTYVTDALKVIGGLNARYYDLISASVPREERSGEEIIASLSDKLNEIGEQ